jgi:tRNA dimethylallyltransferase
MLPLEDLSGKIICIYGPTASYKSAIAIKIGQKVPSVIINADAMQLYKNVQVLTAQPEDLAEGGISHKLYRFIDIDNIYSVSQWLSKATLEIKSALAEGNAAIVAGGTGLYFSSLINGLTTIPKISETVKAQVKEVIADYGDAYMALSVHDKDLAMKLNRNDRVRVIRGLEVKIGTGKSILTWQENTKSAFPQELFYKIYVKPEREVVYNNIEQRFEVMLQNGVVDEVKLLLSQYDIESMPKIIGLESIYKFLQEHCSYNDMVLEVQKLSRNYAKRQYTWFNNQLQHHMHVNSLASF